MTDEEIKEWVKAERRSQKLTKAAPILLQSLKRVVFLFRGKKLNEEEDAFLTEARCAIWSAEGNAP